MRILLVEDDRDIARFVKKGLLENGYTVDVNFDGETGVHAVLQRYYDLVVLDIMLPKMDGREVLRKMRGMEIHTPVIFLTAKDSE
jgi:DNA-binding response OmpR family regulator